MKMLRQVQQVQDRMAKVQTELAGGLGRPPGLL